MDSFDLKGYLLDLRRFWWAAFFCLILGLGIAGYFYVTGKAMYRCQAKLVVTGHYNIPSASAYEDGSGDSFFGTQALIMQSRDVRMLAQKQLEAQGKRFDDIPVEINATYVPKTAVFILDAASPNAEYAQAYLGEVIKAFIEFRRAMRKEQSQEAVSALAEELVRVRREVDSASKALTDFQSKVSIGSLEEEVKTDTDYLNELRRRVASLRLQKSVAVTGAPDPDLAAKSIPLDSNSNPNTTATDDGQTESVTGTGDVLAQRAELAQLQAERSRLLANLRPGHPKIKELDAKIARVQTQLSLIKTDVQDTNKEKIDSIQREIDALNSEIKDREANLNRLNNNQTEFQNLKDRLSSARDSYQRLNNSVQNVDVSSQVDQEVINVLEKPSAPWQEKLQLPTVAAQGGIGGAVAGLALVFLLAKMSPRFQTIQQVKKILGLPIFGRVLKDNWMTARRTVLDSNRKHVGFAESFRNLRSVILHLAGEYQDRKCIAISSALPHEGKSTVAVNLAIALAAADYRVLLIDGDIRRGRVHQLLRIRQVPGLSDLITSKCTADEAIHTTRMSNLMFIASGHRIPDVSEELVKSEFEKTIDGFIPQYDYIIIDSAPILATEDGPTMCTYADWVLFVL
ncbi:MAG: polysaccharide biosynthesis tyrosine autokinase, partial [Verrucomicrobia bacterium]|nr:polysaccharide biosynthesis tyrosine autokinase [Verrucomicrobiota bacterium]